MKMKLIVLMSLICIFFVAGKEQIHLMTESVENNTDAKYWNYRVISLGPCTPSDIGIDTSDLQGIVKKQREIRSILKSVLSQPECENNGLACSEDSECCSGNCFKHTNCVPKGHYIIY